MRAWLHLPLVLLPVGTLGGCATGQSALRPTGVEAHQVNLLFWGMTGFLALIFAGVFIIGFAAWRGGLPMRTALSDERFVIGAGLVFPVVGLSVLFVWGLMVMGGRAGVEAGGVHATIVGEQWWWRVIYTLPDGRRIESANELRIPVGEPVSLELRTADVIHSFWVPNLAGKLDMIPGRANVLTLTATEPGISRGQCAEYCGGAHALMAFHVVAMELSEYQAWLEKEAADAASPSGDALTGARLFMEAGCAGCHTIRGTPANGVIGPDLTHVGGRLSLAAATLPNTADAFALWIAENQHIKPDNHMPPYQIFSEGELAALAEYLAGLR